MSPLKGFYCPDKQTISKEDCFIKCRLGQRCRSLRYLVMAGDDRKYNGKFSTTQLLNAPRVEYLKIITPYYINPDDRAFAVLGTRGHAKLDYIVKSREEIISEYFLDGDQTGILDALEPDCQNDGMWVMTDDKTWGSYKVYAAIKEGDIGRETMQLNNYRVKAENDKKLAEIVGKPIKVSRLQIEAIVKDGSTKNASMNGLEPGAIFMISVPKLPDTQVIDYFCKRGEYLQKCLDSETLPRVCTAEENWNWKMCRKFCDIWFACPEGRKINARRLANDNLNP